MKRFIKILLCGLFAAGLTVLLGTYTLKAQDNTLIADLDGDGTEEIVYYDSMVKDVDEENMEYSFDISIDGEQAWSEGGIIELHPENPDINKLHNFLWGLGFINVEIIDVNPKDTTKEIIASYYASEDNVLLGIKVFRMKKDKLSCICEDCSIMAYSYIPKAQKNNKYLTVASSIFTSSFGTIWVKLDYKLTKKGLVLKPAKSGVYDIAPDFYEEGKANKFKAARNIKVYSDKNTKEFKGELAKKAKFTLKKIKYTANGYDSEYSVYIKASGIKGWIKVFDEYDEYGTPLDIPVTNPVWFS